MKKFIFLALLVIQLRAADDHSLTVVSSHRGSITNFSFAPADIPEIKIQECMQCRKETTQKCGICKFTFYCSVECQRSHWSQHKQGCKKLAAAHNGNIECMNKVISTYLQKAIKTKKKEFVKDAFLWFKRIRIRLKQDVDCSKDSSTQASFERIAMECGQLISELIAQNICTKDEMESLDQSLVNDAYIWVKELTESNKLVPPFGIRRYGIQAFINPQMNQEEEFIPEDQWYEKRMNVLKEYATVFNLESEADAKNE